MIYMLSAQGPRHTVTITLKENNIQLLTNEALDMM